MKPAIDDIPAPRERDDCFSVESFLAAGARDTRALEALVKRVTVGRRLHAFYDREIAKPVGEAGARPEYARLYVAALIEAAERAHDWKLLNAAFAALDGGLAELPVDSAVSELSAAEGVLARMEAHGA